MIETTNRTGVHLQVIHAAHNEYQRDYREREQHARADYYRAYYRALVEEHARNRRRRCSSGEVRRGLEAIKMQRRKARREKWMQSVRSLVAGVLNKSEAMN